MSKIFFLGTFQQQQPEVIRRNHADIVAISKAIARQPIPTKKGLTSIILVDIVTADFRCSEKTIWEGYLQKKRLRRHVWENNETVLFVSATGKIAFFMMGETRINNCVVLDTRKWRLTGPGETWYDLDNLQYYAYQCGFQLIIPGERTVLKFKKAA